MILISHRGNTNGISSSLENEPTYIDNAINNGFDVEIDIWYINEILFLGHDRPDYTIDMKWILYRKDRLWIHCKNIDSIVYLNKNFPTLRYFWHQADTLTITSNGFLWVFPGNQPIDNSIAVLPELKNDDVSKCIGICSDHIEKYKHMNE